MTDDSYMSLTNIRSVFESGGGQDGGRLFNDTSIEKRELSIPDLTEKDPQILLSGNLSNYHVA